MTQTTRTGDRGGQGREQQVADVFVTLADTLVDDYDVVDLLDRLVKSCVDLLQVTAAGLLLDDQRGNLTVVASSNEETHLLEAFQLQTDQGPCLDCVRAAAPVISGDLAAETTRWPLFAPAAVAAGFRSVTAVPLRLRQQAIGGLNLFGEHAEAIPPADRKLAQALADVATIGILQQRSVHRSAIVAEQLQHALNSRVVIEQAKGVLAERGSLTMQGAFNALREYSRTHNLKLTDVALNVVSGQLDVAAKSSQPPTT